MKFTINGLWGKFPYVKIFMKMKIKQLVLCGVLCALMAGCSYHATQDSIIDTTKTIAGSIKSAALKTTDAVSSGVKETGGALSDGFKKTSRLVSRPFTRFTHEDEKKESYQLKSERAYGELVEDVSVHDIVDLSDIKRPAGGYVVRGELLSPFGVVLLAPFRPGVDVVDNELSDDVAIRVVRGIRDVLMNNNEHGRFDVVFNETTRQADYIINGYITKIKDASLIDTFMLNADKFTIGVRGQMRDKDSDDVILTFKDEITFSSNQISHKGLADIIGQNIAAFILEQINSERAL